MSPTSIDLRRRIRDRWSSAQESSSAPTRPSCKCEHRCRRSKFSNANAAHRRRATSGTGTSSSHKPGLGFGFHDGLHRFLHTIMLSADFADSRRFLSKYFKLPRINANRDVCISVYVRLSRISIFDFEIPARWRSAICLATRTPSVLFSLTV